MDAFIEQRLWDIKSSIEPTQAQKEAAQRSHTNLRTLLDSGNIGNRITGSYLSGSYARDTAIRPIDDVDIIFLIDPSQWAQNLFEAVKGQPSPASVLQTFSNAIRYRYPVSSVYYQRRSVRLSMFHLDIDVVPAIPQDQYGNVILIPDSNQDQWIKSAPKIHAEKATRVNQLRGGRLKPLIKLLKKWNSGIPATASLKSFCIETLATRIFAEVNFETLLDGLILFWDFVSRFGAQTQFYRWPYNYNVSWGGLFETLNVPDSAGTNSNTAAGVDIQRRLKFAEVAARSRDRLLSAKNALYTSTANNYISEALYI
ncbi:MAG: hypothetical protein P4M14_01105 [Gammaproteobacteria bacterium]|nr:hypothetical protein [Gammaproteobacteria bacterium]